MWRPKNHGVDRDQVSHLRVFESIAYVHVPEQERSKLDAQSEMLIFIGGDKNSQGYKLFNPSNERIVVSRDVDFDEYASWDWNPEKEGSYDYLPYFEDERDFPRSSRERYSTNFTISITTFIFIGSSLNEKTPQNI